MLKSFFRKLPEPLFTDEYYDAFIETSNIKDDQTKIKRIRNLLIGLPQHHYRDGLISQAKTAVFRWKKPEKSTAKYLMRHLNRVANSTNTRMDSKNLATVIAPNLIRSTMATLINDVEDLNNQCNLVDLLISKYEFRKLKSYSETRPLKSLFLHYLIVIVDCILALFLALGGLFITLAFKREKPLLLIVAHPMALFTAAAAAAVLPRSWASWAWPNCRSLVQNPLLWLQFPARYSCI